MKKGDVPPGPEVLHIHAEEGLAKVFRHPDTQKIPRSNGHTAAPGKIEKEEEGIAVQIREGGQKAAVREWGQPVLPDKGRCFWLTAAGRRSCPFGWWCRWPCFLWLW